jgi:hypothetical protein
MQLTTRQRRFEHIASVYRTLGLAGTDHGVQLVDKDNGLTFVLGQFVEHRFESLFKFAPEFGTRQQGGHIQRQNALALERIGYLARHDALCQTFHDGGLAHARLANEHWVVFGATLQNLNSAPDLVVTAYHRVELAYAGPLRQIEGVFFQGFALPFRIGVIDFLATAHGVNGQLERFACQPRFAGRLSHLAFVIAQGQEKQLTGNECVIALDAFFFGHLQQAHQLTTDLHLLLALHLRQFALQVPRGFLQGIHTHTRALQQGLGAILLVQHHRHQVRRLDIGMIGGQCQRARFLQGLAEFGGQFVNSHGFLEENNGLKPIWGRFKPFQAPRYPSDLFHFFVGSCRFTSCR